MGKKEREQFTVKNDPDIRTFKKAFFVVVYVGLFIITLALINTIIYGFTHAYTDPIYPNSSASYNLYNYTFSTDTLTEITTPNYTSNQNNYNETIYSNPYNATYTFTDDVAGLDPNGWNILEPSGTVNVINDFNTHDKVVETHDTGTGVDGFYQDFTSDQVSGTIEFWIAISDISKQFSQRFYENTYLGTEVLRTQISASHIQWVDGSGAHNSEIIPINNVWYHFKIVFDSTTDKLDIYVNNILIANQVDYANPTNNVGAVYFFTGSTVSNFYSYADAIDYSWDDYYVNNRNFFPNRTYTGESQVAYWDFWHNEAGEYSSLISPIPFFTELTPAGSGDVECENGYLYTTTLYDTDGINGFYKTFSFNNGFFNVTWKDKIGTMYTEHKDAWYGTALYDQSSNLITEVNVTYSDITGIYSLQYNNGTNFVNLTSLVENTYYEFNLYTDGSVCILRFNHSQVFTFSCVSYSDGLGKISFTQAQLDDIDYRIDTKRYTDYVGVFVNGTSQSTDMRTINVDLGVTTFKPYVYYYMDIAVGGNYSLALVDDSYSETYREYGSYTNETETFNIYDFGEVSAPAGTPPPLVYHSNNPFIAFTTNQTLNFVSIKIYSGIILNDGDADYYSEISYYNLTNNDISFTAIDNALHFNATFNYTTGQYAMFNFYRDTREYLDEYVIDTSAYINDTGATCLLSVNYDYDPPTNLTFNTVYTNYYKYLATYNYLTNIIIIISDDPADNYNKSISGYLNNFTISYLKIVHPILPTAQNWVSLVIIACCVFPVPLIIFVRIKKRYPDEKHDLLKYLIPAIIGCVITTALYFGNPDIMPLFVYVTLFIGFFLLILPSMLNRYLILGLMFTSLMVYGGYFPSWIYVINLLIVSFTTILAIKNMRFGDR